MIVILDFVPYHTFLEASRVSASIAAMVLGVSNYYKCVDRGCIEARFAVFEEADCVADPMVFVGIARRASVDAFGEDLVAMVVKTGKGFHIYLDLWTHSYFEALLLAARYRNMLPAICRDMQHIYLAVEMLQRFRWYRYVLRVSNTKYVGDKFEILYRRRSRDRCHELYLSEVEKLYRAPPAL